MTSRVAESRRTAIEQTRSPRLWLLTNTPSPYQVEFFSAVHRSGEIDLDVRFMGSNHRGRDWLPGEEGQFKYAVLGGRAKSEEQRAKSGEQGAGKGTVPICRNGPKGAATNGDCPLFPLGEYGLHPAAVREVLSSRHDFYLLSGHYTSPTFLLCALALTAARKRWGVWLERPWPEDYQPAWATRLSARNRALRGVRNNVLRFLLKSATRVLCIGSAAMEEYARFGAATEKLALLPYICDTSRYRGKGGQPPFVRSTLRAVPANGDCPLFPALRREHGLEGKFVFLFSGQFVERKGIDVLLAAYGRLARERDDLALVLLGDGPLRERLLGDAGKRGQSPFVPRPTPTNAPRRCPVGARLRAVPAGTDRRLVGDSPLFPGVLSPGQVCQAELPAWFAAADAFVFPSRHDGWGVVINEACAAGLPIVTTHAVGAARDLVIEGQNGFVLERDDVDGLCEKMRYLADHPDVACEFGRQSRRLVERFSLPNGIELLRRAIEPAGADDTVLVTLRVT